MVAVTNMASENLGWQPSTQSGVLDDNWRSAPSGDFVPPRGNYFANAEKGNKPMMPGTNNVWEEIISLVGRKLNKQCIDTWFRPVQFEDCDYTQQVIQLYAPSPFIQDWLNSNYSELLREALTGLGMDAFRINWNIGDEENISTNDSIEDYQMIDSMGLSTTKARKPSLFSLLEAAEAEGVVTKLEPVVEKEIAELPLNPKYSFQSFVVGSCNQFAHAAALAITEAPGKTYNPLYIYGGVGLGKTHLMHAAGHAIKERNPHLRLSYRSAERFMNELINAIRYDKAQTFRDKYRSTDVLLIDDIQFMAGKERTQEEFFHTFNALYDGQKQIVITSDCPPREIPTLEERLHSRFEWGLIADIEPPDLETKVAILKRKAETERIDLADDIAFFIASKVKSNIRELEGSLVRLIAIASLRGLPITRALAQDAMRNIAEDTTPVGVSIEQIQKVVAAQYHLRVDEIKSKSNSRPIAFPRQVAMYLCKKLTKHSFPEIGREFGGKHHTTVIHSVEKIAEMVTKDRNFHKLVNELMDSVYR
jgi:chromosomal replication initiator protein